MKTVIEIVRSLLVLVCVVIIGTMSYAGIVTPTSDPATPILVAFTFGWFTMAVLCAAAFL